MKWCLSTWWDVMNIKWIPSDSLIWYMPNRRTRGCCSTVPVSLHSRKAGLTLPYCWLRDLVLLHCWCSLWWTINSWRWYCCGVSTTGGITPATDSMCISSQRRGLYMMEGFTEKRPPVFGKCQGKSCTGNHFSLTSRSRANAPAFPP